MRSRKANQPVILCDSKRETVKAKAACTLLDSRLQSLDTGAAISSKKADRRAIVEWTVVWSLFSKRETASAS
jgi:hypothetical protein